MSTEKNTRYRMFTFMQYLKHPDTKGRAEAKIKSLRSFREVPLKNGLLYANPR